jgi:DNA ligase-1
MWQRAPDTLADGVARENLPLHLRALVDWLSRQTGKSVAVDALDSIPFASLCRGLFLPLSGLRAERAAALFGADEPPSADCDRPRLLADFLHKSIGLTVVEKIACVLGDPFLGKASTFRQDRLLRLLSSTWLRGKSELLNRLAVVGEVAALFAESRPHARVDPPLTAAEVLRTLRILPELPVNTRLDAARSILERCGKLEAYFLAKLLMSQTGLGLEVDEPSLARALAARFATDEAAVLRAILLSDPFHVAGVLEQKGPPGLAEIRLRPLSPVRPALASGTTAGLAVYPVWVERKYDGIRFLLHKETEGRGVVRAAAFTRNRNNWLDRVPGLEESIRQLPAQSLIVDGELFGSHHDETGRRPADVQEIMRALRGPPGPITFRYVAFDLLYRDGLVLTELPLRQRRQRLEGFLAAAALGPPAPVPLTLSEGQIAPTKADVNRLFRHFVAQGHEGIIAKRLDAPYALAARDPNWLKRKESASLDLVLLGATFSVDTTRKGAFGSYVMGALRPDGTFEDVGDVDGVDREKDAQIQELIVRHGLLTGRRIERLLTHGTRAGMEFVPSLVVMVQFQKVTRESDGTLSLRHPVIKAIRSDKSSSEADTVETIFALASRSGPPS